jgi:pilus assembly protein Flp/PilA
VGASSGLELRIVSGYPLKSTIDLRVPEKLNHTHADIGINFGLHAMTLLRMFLRDESGATAIEYGLIAAGISLAIISIVNGLGTNLRTKFTSINTSLK